ncbi:MAG: benzoate-CoA ligase family protein [Roseiarcus sp.]|jgi:2-aminobenzoate-CoA ligase
MHRSAHVDTFARDRLPPTELWPALLLDRPEFAYPERLNCVSALLDRWIEKGEAGRRCLVAPGEAWSYGELAQRVNRIANVLVGRLGLVPGGRVLLRAANNPMLVAIYLAVMKAGGIAVATMPLLRAGELAKPIEVAAIRLALCDARLTDEMDKARALAPRLERVVTFNGGDGAGLEAMMADASPEFAACDTASDDVCLLSFTSGTTGGPKATMHFHRDVLAIADAYGAHVLRARGDDLFIGSPPLAFTFGLGGLVIFPMAVGAASALIEKAGPNDLLEAIERFRPTILFTAPTSYRAMLAARGGADLSSLRLCVSAGETLPLPTFEAWKAATGISLMDGIGATEMLHIFIASPPEDIRPGSTGRPVFGYEARIVDRHGVEVPRGTSGELAVRGPTGCRYLADPRQTRYVRDGWNVTGDTFVEDEDGYFWFQARSDDMIVSAGYNISGPEVEASLVAHAAVAECAVVGAPDEARGVIVKAYVVLRPGFAPDRALVAVLQEHVKADIAPYKYPRAIEFRAELPKTASGKIQRAALRAEAEGRG